MAPLNHSISDPQDSLSSITEPQVETTAAERLRAESRDSLVKVVARDAAGTQRQICDGFLINDGTEVVTSHDIFEQPEFRKGVKVMTSDGVFLKAEIEKISDDHEEVVLKLPGSEAGSHKALKLGSSEELNTGADVFLYGHKYGYNPKTERLTATAGIEPGKVLERDSFVSTQNNDQVERQYNYIDCDVSAASALPGSPLLNSKGEVVGMFLLKRDEKAPGSANNIVVCDDVSELKEVLKSSAGTQSDDAATPANVIDMASALGDKTSAGTKMPVDVAEKPSMDQLDEIVKLHGGPLTKPTIVELFAPWCGPCQAMKPILEDAKKKHSNSIDVLRLDVDQQENRKLAKLYHVLPSLEKREDGFSVVKPGTGIPFTVFIGVGPKGEVLWQGTLEGYSPDGFKHFLDHLVKDEPRKK